MVAAVCGLVLGGAASADSEPATAAAVSEASFRLDTAETRPATAASPGMGERLARLLVSQGDPRGRPFVVVDKQRAEVFVHAADGRLMGRSPALLGSAAGDDSVPGVGERTQRRELRPEDRTTPAGRFVARVGRNLTGERVVWVDWHAALAIHRLRDGASFADRERRLARAPHQRRVSDGCVVVPGAFFDEVVLPTLAGGASVVYILPERPERPPLQTILALEERQAL